MKHHVRIGAREFEVEIRAGANGAEATVRDGLAPERRVRMDSGSAGLVVCDGRRRLHVRASITGAAPDGHVRLESGALVVTALVESERDRLRSAVRPASTASGPVTIASVLPGVIRRVLKKAGDAVEVGEAVLTLEAMKMENEVRAEARGRIRTIRVAEGQVVNSGDVLFEVERGAEIEKG